MYVHCKYVCISRDHSSSEDIANILTNAGISTKTRFLIAWSGITGKDELRSARLEIIKAKVEGKFVLVFTKKDFLKIAAGIHPEKLVEDKYYALIYDEIK